MQEQVEMHAQLDMLNLWPTTGDDKNREKLTMQDPGSFSKVTVSGELH